MHMEMDGVQRLAINTTTGAVVHCADADADELREACRVGTVICPAPSCAAPALATVVSHDRVKGWFVQSFRHVDGINFSDGTHTGQSVCVPLVQRELSRWLQDLGHRTEMCDPDLGGSGRVPTFIAHVQGVRYAIEVQYGPIADHVWSERCDEIEANGAVPWWLWATDVRTRSAVSISEAQLSAVARYGQLWHVAANLSQRVVIGEALDSIRRPGRRAIRRPDRQTSEVRVQWNAPQALMIAGRGVLDPEAEQRLATAQAVPRRHTRHPASKLRATLLR